LVATYATVEALIKGDAMANSILIGKTEAGLESKLSPRMANRHGLVAGATGTGKTVTLQRLAEQFSALGVPVFTADVKGDLSGVAASGVRTDKLNERVTKLGITTYTNRSYPTVLWDLTGKSGHPIRTTISEFGPLLLSRVLDLSEAQEGVLQIAFRLADEQGLLLLDLDDLKAVLAWMQEQKEEVSQAYGNVAPQTVATLSRKLLSLEESGARKFFGEPALRLEHLMQVDSSGRGIINVLDARQLVNDGRLYSTFLLWLLSELFEELDEVGDVAKPRLVFFFDEAHLLFDDAPKMLVDKIEQVVKLIRSKGVGVYFVTQNPTDIPDSVLAQLGNRMQHALRAFTPKEQKAVRVAAQSFRANPKIETEKVITELGIGEALVSVLDDSGVPSVVERVIVAPPESRLGPLTDGERSQVVSQSIVSGIYDKEVNRESAFELLRKRKEATPAPASSTPSTRSGGGGYKRQSSLEAFCKSVLRTVGTQLGREIYRGIFGSMRIGRSR
jgi:hypothetical protein